MDLATLDQEATVYGAGGQPSGYAIRYRVERHRIDFAVWNVCYVLDGPVEYIDESAASQPAPHPRPEDAVPFMEGQLKWDGCCDLRFPGQDHCMLHFCGAEDGADLGRIMAAVYALGPEMEAWHA
jgi:hypothetical protein